MVVMWPTNSRTVQQVKKRSRRHHMKRRVKRQRRKTKREKVAHSTLEKMAQTVLN
ncbi:hypothetical protein KIN20_009763 [Parelaphostrongylus tenuis]|uniref:Uncharacterized protein n=1 Tax=Parelaphostrongylus tenuis TaxID=148309 RepID=A0AAD5QJV8_PARTN|nr:hypothetical protein KIN20_009763 [Parelaphostrongylus tenuis]